MGKYVGLGTGGKHPNLVASPERIDVIIADLKKGDRVIWRTSQGETKGKVVKKQTTPTKIKGHEVKASKSGPQVFVESSKTGAKVAHKPIALKKTL